MIKRVFLIALLSTPTALAQTTLSAMSFNIHHGESVAGQLELEAIADVIRTHTPDVIGLQEVDRHFSERSAFRDQAADLARMLEMNHCFGANLDSPSETPGQPRSQYGTAILSPHPLENCHNTLLPQQGEDEQRGLLGATVERGGQRFHIYTTHLQHDSEAARQQQADAIVAELEKPATRTILMGDLNATPKSAEITTLTTHLQDSWIGAGRGSGATYPAEAPDSRIDYVLASGDLRAIQAEVIKTQTSDHRPVLVTFSISPD